MVMAYVTLREAQKCDTSFFYVALTSQVVQIYIYPTAVNEITQFSTTYTFISHGFYRIGACMHDAYRYKWPGWRCLCHDCLTGAEMDRQVIVKMLVMFHANARFTCNCPAEAFCRFLTTPGENSWKLECYAYPQAAYQGIISFVTKIFSPTYCLLYNPGKQKCLRQDFY